MGGKQPLTTLMCDDCNPVRTGLVGEATAFRWSSAGSRVGGSDAVGLPAGRRWKRGAGARNGSSVCRAVDADEARRLQEATLSGASYDSAAFVEEPARRFGRSLAVRGRGRPKKRPTGSAAGT